MKVRITIFLLGVLLAIFLVKPKVVQADCADYTALNTCPAFGHQTNCALNGRLYCCNTPAECSAIQSGQQGTSGTTPTTGCKDPNSINTAIGCVPVLAGNTAFAGFILKWAVGVGSGIAFILILYAGFMIMTSQGNPDRLKAGQELLTSAISGLILIVLSVFILKFIGIDILGLGKFGFGQ